MADPLQTIADKLVEFSSAAKAAPSTEVVELWKAAATAYAGHWTFYVLGTSAVLGFAFSDKFLQIPTTVRRALFVLFALFLTASFFSVIQNLLPYNAATEYLRSHLRLSNPEIAKSIYITCPSIVVLLHLAVDACAVRIVWLRVNQPTVVASPIEATQAK